MPQKERTRFFAVVTYRTDTRKLIETLQSKGSSIRAYALILHDRDEVDVHHHIVIRTYSAWKPLQVAKWFADDSGQNTFAQPVHDRQAIIDYLTHKGDFAEDGKKAVYTDADIIDGGLDDIKPIAGTADDSYEIIQALLDDVPLRELCKRYGRDFIYHFHCYAMLADKIREQES